MAVLDEQKKNRSEVRFPLEKSPKKSLLSTDKPQKFSQHPSGTVPVDAEVTPAGNGSECVLTALSEAARESGDWRGNISNATKPMSEYWEEIYHRGQQSIRVWNTFAPGFVFGEVTLAGHMTDVTGLQTKANERDVQQDVLDVARLSRDGNLKFMEDLCVRFPRKLEGDLAANDPLHAEIADLRDIVPDTADKIVQRTRRTVSLWNRINAQRAAAVPPQAAFQVGASIVAHLDTALANQNGLMQGVENERGKHTQKNEALRTLATKVDRNNKRWFAAWEGEFAAGSPERAALSLIDTGSPTPLPTVLEIQHGHGGPARRGRGGVCARRRRPCNELQADVEGRGGGRGLHARGRAEPRGADGDGGGGGRQDGELQGPRREQHGQHGWGGEAGGDAVRSAS